MSDVSTYDTEHSIGENNVQFLGLDMHNPVFFISAVLVVLFVIGTIMFPEPASVALSAAKAFAGPSYPSDAADDRLGVDRGGGRSR